MNPLDKAVQLCGGPSALAKAIGVSPSRLGNWRARGVPIECCFSIERATGGRVSRKDLRPLDWQSIWPELASMDAGHAGRQLPSSTNILDTVPEHSVVGVDPRSRV
ncbi:transcriptional regulator [Janthinobacterium lividum]|uniref:transcriptional regulator n=1 Tax=Janthinobacterium lividum TaxID=29581 RepID=UPI0032B19B0F